MNCRIAARLAFALAIVHALHSFAQTPVWTLMPGAPAGTTPRFDDISFINERTGWVARATAGIFKTTDAGNTFTLSRSSAVSGLTAHFRALAFVSAARGFAGNLGPGSYDAAVTDTNILYETFDGGTTWFKKPGLSETGMKGLCAIFALDDQHIYGAGRVRGPAYFIKSTDGGTNWSVTNLTAAGVMGGLMDVYFHDETNGFVVGMDTNAFNSCSTPYYHGAIARTTNGGLTWKVVAATALNCCYFWKMSWPSRTVGYVSLQQNGSMAGGNHIFYKTTDGGATWVSNGIPFSAIGISSFYWQGVGFVSENEGWAGGDSASGSGNFLHTINGGASWTPVGASETLRVNRIRILRPDYAVASGARVLAYRVPLGVTASPTNQTVANGSHALFSVAGQGTPPLSYQWRFNGNNIPAAIMNSFLLPVAWATNAGGYSVIISDVTGSVTSSVANLIVSGVPAPANIAAPRVAESGFGFSIATEPFESYTIQRATNLAQPDWADFTNFTGNGALLDVVMPLDDAPQYFRVRRP